MKGWIDRGHTKFTVAAFLFFFLVSVMYRNICICDLTAAETYEHSQVMDRGEEGTYHMNTARAVRRVWGGEE
jgi:hypothetical protein